MNLRIARTCVTLAAALLTTGTIAQGQTLPNPGPPIAGSAARGERGSAHDLILERRRLERIIDGLQRDAHDFGGHRVQAIELLRQARAQLDAALQYDAANPGK